MKILQFTPHPVVNKGQDKPDPGGDFASVFKTVSSRSSPAAGGSIGIVSLENQRALRLPPSDDLGRARSLLGRLDQDLRASTPEILNSLHDLQGLIYVRSTR